jgi:hypothetical protein
VEISRAIRLTVLLTIVWMAFAYNLYSFTRASPPKANVVPGSYPWPEPTATMIANADLSLPFVTKESFEQNLAEFRSRQITRVALATLFGIGTVVIGTLLEGSLAFGLSCLIVGPVRTIYVQYAESK